MEIYERSINYQMADQGPRIKVAILDTGLDLQHPELGSFRGQIKDYQSFLPPERQQPPFADTHGHGTHVAGLLLRTAPHSDVYIAQIADTVGVVPPNEVAEVSDAQTNSPLPVHGKFP